MTLQDIYNNINVIIKKETRGNRISPSDFNRVLESANEAFFKRKLDLYLRSPNSEMQDGELDTRFIESYLTLNAANALAAGVLDLTGIEADVDDIAAIVSVKGTYASAYRKIDYVTPNKAQEALHNLMGHRLTSYPLCYRVADNLYFLPNDVTSVDIIYAEWPDVPFLDYYIDVDGYIVYFDAGDGAHVWATGEIDSDGDTRTLGDPNYTPATIELEYEPTYHYEFMIECLAQFGLSLSDTNLEQYTEGKKQQVNQR